MPMPELIEETELEKEKDIKWEKKKTKNDDFYKARKIISWTDTYSKILNDIWLSQYEKIF